MDKKQQLLFLFGFAIISMLIVIGTLYLKPKTYLYPEFSLKEDSCTFLEEQPSVSLDLVAPPRLAYLISGSKGDGMQIRRTLQAIYHPRNYYVLHLDLKASLEERNSLDRYLHDDPIFQKQKNVIMIEEANLVTYVGPTMVSTTLHGAAILLKKYKDWDWFINLSAKDYPLATQDDILHVFSSLPRSLNFIEHTKLSDFDWKIDQRAKPIHVDPALYMVMQSPNLMKTNYNRQIPTAYELFTGSAWMVLSRSFVEYTIIGWDNWPRKILMYYANTRSPAEGYFQTVLCKSKEFKTTVVNHDLHYITWNIPPTQHPLTLTMKNYNDMKKSGALFARKFEEGDHVLALIDKELLGRAPWEFTPGGWCNNSGLNSCADIGNSSHLQPGPGAQRLQGLMESLLAEPNFHALQCSELIV